MTRLPRFLRFGLAKIPKTWVSDNEAHCSHTVGGNMDGVCNKYELNADSNLKETENFLSIDIFR